MPRAIGNIKECSTCHKKKPLSEFYKGKENYDGYKCQCKRCMAKYNSTIAAVINKKRYKEKHPDRIRNSRLKSAFSLSVEIYDKMFNDQQGCCKICGYQETEESWGCAKRLAVDHNHKTLNIRGLLCSRCNKLLGMAQDDVDLLKKCISYLEQEYE